MTFVSKFTFALFAGVALIMAGAPQAAFAADELTIVSWGGAYQESQRKAYFEPFIKEGNKVTEEEYNGEIAKIRAMVESNAVTWDVIDVDTQTALAACAEGFSKPSTGASSVSTVRSSSAAISRTAPFPASSIRR